jgi:hypothetical protein
MYPGSNSKHVLLQVPCKISVGVPANGLAHSSKGTGIQRERERVIHSNCPQTRSSVLDSIKSTCQSLICNVEYHHEKSFNFLCCCDREAMLQRLSSASCRGARALRHTQCFAPASQTSLKRLPLQSNWHLNAAAAAEVANTSSSSTPATSSGTDTAASPAPAYKVPLDFKFIRDNVQMIAENCRLRNSAADPALVAQLYEEFLQIKAETEALRASRNENSAAMKVRGPVRTCVGSQQQGMKALGGAGWGGGGQNRGSN